MSQAHILQVGFLNTPDIPFRMAGPSFNFRSELANRDNQLDRSRDGEVIFPCEQALLNRPTMVPGSIPSYTGASVGARPQAVSASPVVSLSSRDTRIEACLQRRGGPAWAAPRYAFSKRRCASRGTLLPFGSSGSILGMLSRSRQGYASTVVSEFRCFCRAGGPLGIGTLRFGTLSFIRAAVFIRGRNIAGISCGKG